jgi:galactonate dehydratase
MMPDVKYAGGPDEMMRIAALFGRFGVAFSPHNPSGPICHIHSLHICAALGASDLLEHQFDETPLFDAVIAGGLAKSSCGYATPDWDRAGLGADLVRDPKLVSDVDLGTRGTER